MSREYSLRDVLRILYQWRKFLLFTVGGAFVLSLIISLLIPVYYQSRTVFYAASQDLFKPEKIFGYGSNEMYFYGSGEDIERILTAGRSNELADFLVDSFDLYTHYRINPDHARADYKVREKLFGLYKIIRTKYDAIELSVEDRDRELAAAIANAARNRIDAMLSDIIKSSQRRFMESFQASISEKENRIREILDSLNYYQHEFGIYSPDVQMEYLSELATSTETRLVRERARLESYKTYRYAPKDTIAKMEAVIKGLEEESRLLNDPGSESTYNLQRFNAAKGKIEVLDDEYRKALNQVNYDKERLKQYRAGVNLKTSALHIVQEAEIPMIKSRPKKSLIVISATFAVFLFSLVLVLFIESYRNMDWKVIRPETSDQGQGSKP